MKQQYVATGCMEDLSCCACVQGTDKRQAYFPQGKWHNLFDNSTVEASDGGKLVTLELPVGQVAVHMPAGHIIPMQQPALVTEDVRASPLTLVVALPAMRLLPNHQQVHSIQAGSTPPHDNATDSSEGSSHVQMPHVPHEPQASSVSRQLLSETVPGMQQPAGIHEARNLIACGLSEPGLSTACGQIYMDDGDQIQVNTQCRTCAPVTTLCSYIYCTVSR